LKATYPKSES